MRHILSLLLVCAPAPLSPSLPQNQEPEKNPRPWHAEILNQHHIPLNNISILEELRRRLPNASDTQQARNWLRGLGHDRFTEREKATAALKRLGPSAVEPLTHGLKSADPEVAARCRVLLDEIRSDQNTRQSDVVITALLQEAALRRVPGAAQYAAQILERNGDQSVHRAAQETLWHAAQKSESDWVKSLLASPHVQVKSAAFVAWATLSPREAIAELDTWLKDPAPEARLAACRAFVNAAPDRCLPALAELAASDIAEIEWEAKKILTAALGANPLQQTDTPQKSSWADRVKNARSQPIKPVDDGTRLSWGSRFSFWEAFGGTGNAAKGWQRFSYRGAPPARAEVKQGQLFLFGDQPEGDQWLELPAPAAWGAKEFPPRLSMHARLGGEAAGAGGYHVGLVAGNLKIVIHPGYQGGGLRLERDDNHAYLTPNEDLGFTPEGSKCVDLTLALRLSKDGDYEAEITIDPALAATPVFHKSYSVKASDVGNLSRIAIVRSGREGGAGIFDSIRVEALP